MALVRLSTLVSVRKAFTSSGLGISPVRSRVTRRRNSVSVDGLVQRTPSLTILPKISLSMKLTGVNCHGSPLGGVVARRRGVEAAVGAASSAFADIRCQTAGGLFAAAAARLYVHSGCC